MSDALITATALRFPIWKPGTPTSTKVAELETHVCVTAFWQGEMVEQRMGRRAELDDLAAGWDGLQGWEPFRRNKTEAAVDDAKRQLRPDLHLAICEVRQQVGRLSQQIDRMEREFTKASRVYTFLTGG